MEQLTALARGELGEDLLAVVAAHVDTCSACADRVESLEDVASDVIAVLRRSTASGAGDVAAAAGLPVLEAGALLGDYVIDGPLGEGGMGQVYRATHLRMRRTVAIKVMSRSALGSPELVERFRREVEVVARLSHPNVALAYDAREWEGRHYLVMEYISGQDLARHVRERGPIPALQAVAYLIQAARGLSYAHRHGIVHRDVKPANLMLDDQGTIKVLDLGLARHSDAEDLPIAATGPSGVASTMPATTSTARYEMTQAGTILGTMHTMPPEQALGAHHADARSDIYSLGCTLYYLVTGRYPFAGRTVRELMAAHRDQDAPSLASAASDVSSTLESIFHRMVAKRPQDRYATLDEVIADLERCASEPARRRKRRWLAVGTTLLAATTLSLIPMVRGWNNAHREPPSPVDSGSPALRVPPFSAPIATEYQAAWARHVGRPVERTNSIGMKFVLVPPGEFSLRTNYRVVLTRPIEIGAHEVTVGQFRRFVDATGHVTSAERFGGLMDKSTQRSREYNWKSPGFAARQTDDHPVLQVSWRDAVSFCQWLSKVEAAHYRLPTEAEWEWSARAGALTCAQFDPDAPTIACGWTAANAGGHSHPVGRLRGNPWGLFDVAGNAAEWCHDFSSTTALTGRVADPSGPLEGDYRVLLGSAFYTSEASSALSYRGNATEATGHWGFGFRVVCEIPESPQHSANAPSAR